MPTKLPPPVPSLTATVGVWLLQVTLALARLAERLMLGNDRK
jgi:hypothetical protein